MRQYLKTKTLRFLAWVLRKVLVGKRLYRVVSLDGFPSVQDYGKIIGVVYWVKNGRVMITYLDGRKFPVNIDSSRLYRDRNLKGAWAYHD